jgi:hypothetical protein
LVNDQLASRIVFSPIRSLSVTLAACLAVATLAACGGGSSSSSSPTVAKLANAQTLAQVGSYTVTSAMLNQWMAVDVGSDYYKLTKHRAPAQLVSEPPNYHACVAAVQALASGEGERRPAAGTASTCEQLYQAIKAETLTFLVSAYWLIDFDAAHGIVVTKAQVQHSLAQVRAKEYPHPGEFERSLQARDRTLSQEMFLARVDLLKQALREALSKKGQGQAELATAVNEEADSAVCRAGYLVAHCKGIVGHKYSGPLPRTLLRAIAPGTTRAG